MRIDRTFAVLAIIILLSIFAPVFARGNGQAKGRPVHATATPIAVPTLIEYPTWIPETPVLTPLPILGN